MVLKFVFPAFFVAVTIRASPPLQLEVQRGFPPILDPIINNFPNEGVNTRLPSSVIPNHYRLQIVPILDTSLGLERQFTAPGKVEISVTSVEPTPTITLHSKDIEFDATNVKVTTERGVNIEVTDVTFDPEKETVTITLAEELAAEGKYIIFIEFVSSVNTSMAGLYRSSYIDKTNKRRYLATTQFEKTGARMAFPCFDEPALRSVFEIQIGRLKNDYHSLGNMEKFGELDVPDMPGFVYDQYGPTPCMSTYLVAIIVSDFDSTASKNNASVKTWGPPNQIENEEGVFSAEVAYKLIKHFETYFESPYPLAKLDSVAIPDFAAGAMENWGLNTYRVPTLLFVKGDMTQFELWRQAAVIAHEVSHSWFGNLVTIKWWNELWLKEGFARYFQFLGVGAVEPELEAMERVVLDTTQVAMEHDIGPLTHGLRGEWTSNISYQNSRIIYEKGACIIRMMEGILTEGTLQRAFQTYVERYALGSTVQEDLLGVLNEQAHADNTLPLDKDLNVIMHEWTHQDGFPLVRVMRVSPIRLFLSQEKFLSIQNQGFGRNLAAQEGTWEIPVTYVTKSDPVLENFQPKAWISVNEALTSISVNTTSEDWILINPDAMSYYRVLYDSELFLSLKQQLDSDHSQFTTASRSQLIDDYFTFATHGYDSYEHGLDLTTFLHSEQSLIVWTTVTNHVRKLHDYLSDRTTFDTLQTYLGEKIKPQLQRLLEENSEAPVPLMLRGLLMDWGCSVDLSKCKKAAVDLIKKWMDAPSEPNPVPADIQPVVYCSAYAEGDEPLKTFIIEQYSNRELSEKQRSLFLGARACERESTKLKKMLQEMVDVENSLTVTERKTLIERIATNEAGRDEILPFLETYMPEVINMLGDDTISMAISTLSTYFSSEEHKNAVDDFYEKFQDQLSEDVKNSILASTVVIEKNIDWNDKHGSSIATWLSNHIS